MNQIEMPVDEFTSPVSWPARPGMTVKEIRELFMDKKIRHIPVVEKGKPIGIISDRDLALLGELGGVDVLTAQEIMVRDPYCVVRGSSLEDVAFEMSQRKIGSAIVVDEHGDLEGIFTSTDGLNALIEVLRGEIQ